MQSLPRLLEILSQKNQNKRPREVAQQLRILSALTEDSGSVPNTPMAARTHLDFQFQGDLMSSSDPFGFLHTNS